MSDLGSFAAQTQSLREQSTYWDDRAGYADAGRAKVEPGVDKGYQFGFLAGQAGVRGRYDEWVAAMLEATRDAGHAARYLKAAMASAADAYDGVDGTTSASMAELDALIEES